MPLQKKRVAIVTPIYRLPLTVDEQISVRHLKHFLGDYDRIIIAPCSLTLDFPGFQVKRFDDAFFQGIPGYNRLMLSPQFYRAFSDYEYILIYQLDCLVFSSDLANWCTKGWDYIGAPWFLNFSPSPDGGLWRVGNGGLSLRNVAKSLTVLGLRRYVEDPWILGQKTRHFKSSPRLRKLLCAAKTVSHLAGYKNNLRWYLKLYTDNEDWFWSLEANKFLPEFRIPTPEKALPFAFEYAPRYCFQHNGRQLPFGCHAWYKIDREFWDPFLLR